MRACAGTPGFLSYASCCQRCHFSLTESKVLGLELHGGRLGLGAGASEGLGEGQPKVGTKVSEGTDPADYSIRGPPSSQWGHPSTPPRQLSYRHLQSPMCLTHTQPTARQFPCTCSWQWKERAFPDWLLRTLRKPVWHCGSERDHRLKHLAAPLRKQSGSVSNQLGALQEPEKVYKLKNSTRGSRKCAAGVPTGLGKPQNQ